MHKVHDFACFLPTLDPLPAPALARPEVGHAPALKATVKINGIVRKGATNSIVDLLLTGSAGTTIMNGTVKDTNNLIWRLPASVVIGVDGTMTATATSSNSGAVAALAGTITTINTPTRGWASVTNPAAATVGAPAETDAELRIRQGQSVALPFRRLRALTVRLLTLLA